VPHPPLDDHPPSTIDHRPGATVSANTKLADEKIDAIIAARRAGMSIAKIVVELGVSETAAKKYAKGVPKPRFTPLTEAIVKTARRDYAQDRTVTVLQLAERYGGVDPLSLAKVLKGEMYAGVKNPRALAALRPEPELEELRRQRT
jgi:predicted transcriptional regulator